MKKIVGILGMAAVLGSVAFAAEPAANFVMAEFTGSAEFGWKADFSKKDALTGMFNKNGASIKFGFVDAGDKTTAGDGIWGELKIKAGATSVKDGKILLGNYKDANEDGVDDHDKTIQSHVSTDDDKNVWLNLPNLFPTAAVETAKIHFVDGDFSLALNLLPPSLKYDGYSAFTATPIGYAAGAIDAQIHDKRNKKINGGNPVYDSGFGIEFAMADMFAANFKLSDNGLKKADEKELALAFDVALKAVENLDLSVAGAFNFYNQKVDGADFDYNYKGFKADAAYKIALSDKLYVKPGVGYSFSDTGLKGDDGTHTLAAGAMFGWGATGLKPELDFISTTSDKFNEGVSVAVAYTKPTVYKFQDKDVLCEDVMKIGVSLYDQSLFNLLGLEDFGTLKTGVEFTYDMGTSKKSVFGDDKTHKATSAVFAAALKYNAKFGIVDVALHGGMKMSNMLTCDVDNWTKPDTVNEFAYGITLGTKEIIDNTNIYVSYDGAYNSSLPENKKGANNLKNIVKSELAIGTKISF